MKNILLGLIISVMSIPAFAGSFNGNVSYNSDYVWRGVSQTQGKPSVHLQGEVISDLGCIYRIIRRGLCNTFYRWFNC